MGLLSTGIFVTLVYFLLTVIVQGAVVSEEIVKMNTTQTTYVEVNTSLVLSCMYEGNSTPKVSSFWRNNNVYTVVIVQGCIYTHSSSFFVTCFGINKVVFILLRTGVEEHGAMWNCAFRSDIEIKSDYTEIKVKVPVSSVMLSSPSDFQVTLTENSTEGFRCETSPSRPIPTLSWFVDDNTPKANDDIPVSQNVSQSPAAGSEDFVATNGSLIYKASRHDNGRYVFCQSRDIDGDIMGSDRKILLNVTFPPSVIEFKVAPMTEGTTLSVECKTEPGNPETTSYLWQRKLSESSENTWETIDKSRVNVSHLQIQNISRQDAGTYECTASNVLETTAEQQRFGKSSMEFELSVIYEPSIFAFFVEGHRGKTNVTVCEYDVNVEITCEVDGVPTPSNQILFEGAVLKNESQTNVTFVRSSVECVHGGIYTCHGTNALGRTTNSINLYVKCSPRPLWQVEQNVSSPLSKSVTFSIPTLAYPEPGPSGFKWHKLNGTKWIPLLSNKYVHISSEGTQSILTILNVTHADFGQYRVTVTNTIGSFKEFFFLEEDDANKCQFMSCDCSAQIEKSALIVGIILGALTLLLGAYSSYLTLLLRRKSKEEGISGKTEPTKPEAYIHFEEERNNDIGELEGNVVKLYTDLVHFSRDDRTIYDVIQKA